MRSLSNLYFCLAGSFQKGRTASFRDTGRFLALLSFLIISPWMRSSVAEVPPSFNLLDAGERGVTVAETDKGTVTPTYDDAAKKDVLEFDYTLSGSQPVRVWGRKFSADLNGENANAIKAGIKTTAPDQASQVAVSLEIVGSAGTQTIPVALRTGWSNIQEPLDWSKVGPLTEIAFLVTPAPGRLRGRRTCRGTGY